MERFKNKDESNYIEIAYEFVEKLPNDFFNKNFNEKFCIEVISSIFGIQDIRKGNPNIFEPDAFLDGVPFEITIVSDKKKHDNLIQRLKNKAKNGFSTGDIEEEILSMMEFCIKKKAGKKYCTPCPYLCLIVPVPIIGWLGKAYGDVSDYLFATARKHYFLKWKEEYIDKDFFSNIFVIVPSLDGGWCCIDMKTDNMCLYYGDFNNERYPYYMELNDYNTIEKCNHRKNT